MSLFMIFLISTLQSVDDSKLMESSSRVHCSATFMLPSDCPRARGNEVRWFIDTDMEAIAMRAAPNGYVNARIDVDAAGSPTRCEIIQSSGYETVDARYCAILMERGRFIPGRGADGVPVSGQWERGYRWSSPGED